MSDSQTPLSLHVAFVVGIFPGVPGAFILNQVADLIDRGCRVTVFAFKHGSLENVSDRYHTYHMGDMVRTMEMPVSYIERLVALPRKFLAVWRRSPMATLRALNVFRFGRNALSGKMLFWAAPFADASFDLVHCHFGPMAMKYLSIKDILRLPQKIVVTFYGFDVSQIVKQKGTAYYTRLIKEASLVLTMSENMRGRVVALGFAPEKVFPLPVSIDVGSYPFARREAPKDGTTRLVSVGRFVEKKGFDDLLRALAELKKKTAKKFLCYIVGEGAEHDRLHALAAELNVNDVISWQNFMKEQDLVRYYLDKHLYVQTSKTAPNGDME